METHAVRQPGDDDLINAAVAHTLLHRGSVYETDKGLLPNAKICAAICRKQLAF